MCVFLCYSWSTQPFSDINPYIHTPSDTISRLSQNHMYQFALFAMGFVVELSFAA